MGQVWSKANFDGINLAGHLGGRGSVIAVTAQNAGPDGRWGTTDDLLAPINQQPVDVSIDAIPDDGGSDLKTSLQNLIARSAPGPAAKLSTTTHCRLQKQKLFCVGNENRFGGHTTVISSPET